MSFENSVDPDQLEPASYDPYSKFPTCFNWNHLTVLSFQQGKDPKPNIVTGHSDYNAELLVS